MRGEAAHDPRGEVIPRPVIYPNWKSIGIKPLQYGDIIKFYKNQPRNETMLAGIFDVAIAPCSPQDVQQMQPGAPSVLEYGVLLASGMLNRGDGKSDPREESQESGDNPEDLVRENSMFTAHQEGRETADEYAPDGSGEINDDMADLFYAFATDYNTGPSGVYRLTLPEIDRLNHGAKRAKDRQEKNNDGGESTSKTLHGSRGDRIGRERNLPG